MNSSFQKVNSLSSIVYDVGQELTGTELKSQVSLEDPVLFSYT